MKDLLTQLNDLPDEILINIFKKLYNDEVLYSLMDVNKRISKIVQDTIFTRDLYLREYFPVDDSTFPLSNPILDRFCTQILPEIGHKIETLYLKGTWIERVFHATNYPNLINLGLCDIHFKLAMSLFCDKIPFPHVYKNKITSLFINFKNENKWIDMRVCHTMIFAQIFTIFTNLRCLKFNPYSSDLNSLYLFMTPETDISSTLLELHVTVSDIKQCLCILDGRFDQLRILYVILYTTCYMPIEHTGKPLPKLRIFSLWCKDKMHNFEKSVVPLLCRMLNLEELHLNIIVQCYEKLIDGETLRKDIVIYMPQLYKFTINICSTIYHRNQTNFPLNEHIQETFQYFPNNEIITCIDHFQEKAYSQCHIYSYPYKWEVYNNITNNFPGGLFMSVTKVLLYDEHSFEYEFFLRISKSFPFMRGLTINNRKAQNKKQFIKSNNDDQILSIIEYPNLQRLNLSDTHDDYVELFLFDTKIFLPNDLHICAHYQSLKTVTHYFTRYTTGSNCVKLAALYVDKMDQINEHIKNYFPDICIREAIDFKLLE
ncbi:unnamed protein product [Rotaria magnacalcarata]|uniref:F-box domain-containing protein n=1 Tax=Rotaria magnacalcarata TaxID=392030 RepID=A0A816Y7G3_9BILA|nr:unnamed protein product [Rotaria magnacalcarata]